MKLNFSNFSYRKNNITFEAARLYFDAMILAHMTYCITSWASACKTILKSLESTYKQAMKVLKMNVSSLFDFKET